MRGAGQQHGSEHERKQQQWTKRWHEATLLEDNPGHASPYGSKACFGFPELYETLTLTSVRRRNEKVELLKRVPLFADCSRGELEQIAQIADEIDLAEGKDLTRLGESGREFFVLLEGEADVSQDGEIINKLGAGDFFGEIALVEDTPRTATVTATTPVRVLVITDRSFKRLLEKQPEIQRKVLVALAERVKPALGS